MSAAPTGLLLCDDLIFTSRISGEAQQLGLTVRSARDVETLLRLAAEHPPACVIVDLQHAGLDLPSLLRDLAAACPQPPRVVGYGSHVAVETLRAARQAGCDPVLPRSKFVEDLPTALPGWLSVEPPADEERRS